MGSSGAHPIAITAWTSVVFAAIGCTISVIGPTLLDLAGRLSVDNDVLASIFPVRAVGGFIGTAASGFVFDRYQGHSYLLLSVFILLTVIVVCLVPLSIHTAMLGVVMFFFGFFMQGFLVNGTQSILLKATQKLRRASSYILFLHFSYAVGATISPLWARPFVSKVNQMSSNMTCLDAYLLPLDTNNTVCRLALNSTCPDNSSYVYVSLAELKLFSCVPSPQTSLLFGWAYWLCAPIYLIALAAFLYFWIRYELKRCNRTSGDTPFRISGDIPSRTSGDTPSRTTGGETPSRTSGDSGDTPSRISGDTPSKISGDTPSMEDEVHGTAAPQKLIGPSYFLSSQPLHIKIIFFSLLSLFTYVYVGIEAFFSNYIFTFSVESGTFTKDNAAILNSLFWATFAMFRFVAILLALVRFPSSLQIVANISGGLIASLVLAIFPREAGVVWAATALIGVCMSSTFPSIVAWLAQQTEVTGKVSALILCMGTLADMTTPLTVATLMTRVTPLAFVYFTVVEYAASISLAIALFIFTWSRKRSWLKHGSGKGTDWKGEEELQLTKAVMSDEEEGEGEEGKENTQHQVVDSDFKELPQQQLSTQL